MNIQNILFVCTANEQRSLTAETIYRDAGLYDVKSAGTDHGARVRVTEEMVGWADLIVVMEAKHGQLLAGRFPERLAGKHLICLDIPDVYDLMSEDLVDILRARLGRHIDIPE